MIGRDYKASVRRMEFHVTLIFMNRLIYSYPAEIRAVKDKRSSEFNNCSYSHNDSEFSQAEAESIGSGIRCFDLHKTTGTKIGNTAEIEILFFLAANLLFC